MTLTEKKRGKIISARKLGKSYKKLPNLSDVIPRQPLILDESAQDRLSQLVLSNRHITKRQIQAVLEQQEGKIISQRTISRTLRKKLT
ncbi:3562_t:CDS:2, partial [Dentiscutata heterogama]